MNMFVHNLYTNYSNFTVTMDLRNDSKTTVTNSKAEKQGKNEKDMYYFQHQLFGNCMY